MSICKHNLDVNANTNFQFNFFVFNVIKYFVLIVIKIMSNIFNK